jgi:SulP family sulfate permease
MLQSLPEGAAVALRKRRLEIPIATALRETLKGGYTGSNLRSDLLAGLVVGVVALPLSMALAIAVGAPPQHGLYTAIVAGAVIALTGGCRYQVSGPTAAFVVVLAPIAAKYGLGGLLTAGLMAGVMLVVMGIARLGRFIQFIPHPVTTGFTTGIAFVIATLQIKDILGLRIEGSPAHFPERIAALVHALPTIRPLELVMAAITFALLLLAPRYTKRVPAPLIALVAASLLGLLLGTFLPAHALDTLGTRFSTVIDGEVVAGIPRRLPSPILPWGPEGLSYDAVRALAPSAFAIAMLGAIESLLSGVIADGLTGTRHDPDAELVGLGLGNILAPVFGGIAATGALARTATNIRAGAHSPFAAVVHAAVVLGSILVLAPYVAYVPMSALAALLVLVAWNMAEMRQFVGILKIAPKSDVAVLVTCFGLTVLFDMVVSIVVGVVLAAMLFMRRMAVMTGGRLLHAHESEEGAPKELPSDVVLYEINGPLFFGAAKSAMGAMRAITDEHPRALIISLGNVPTIDATGLVALDAAISTALKQKIGVVLAGPLPEPRRMFDKARLTEKYTHLRMAPSLEEALVVARDLEPPPGSSARPSIVPAPRAR